MSENNEERKFSKLRFIPAIYMLIAVLFSVILFVGKTNVTLRDPIEGVLFLPLLMAQSAAEIVSPNQVPNSELKN